jgi:FkbM family methyltransferase
VTNVQPEDRESGLAQWLQRVLSPGAVMIDVGANIGHYTTLAAQLVGPGGRVVAIEPAPDNVAKLRERCVDLRQVTIVAAAADEQSGTCVLHLDRDNPTQHSLVSRNVGGQRQRLRVPTVTLDGVGDDLVRLDLVKIDAQGAELRILRGAHRVLQRFRPTLALELWPYGLRQAQTTPDALLDELIALGYTVHRVSTAGQLKDASHIREFLTGAGRWNSINIAAVPARQT